MAKLIDADLLKDRLKWGWTNDKFVLRQIDEMPEADPVKHGRWIFGFDPETGERDLKAWTCSECNEKYPWQPNYCPNCGAKMNLGEEDEQER